MYVYATLKVVYVYICILLFLFRCKVVFVKMLTFDSGTRSSLDNRSSPVCVPIPDVLAHSSISDVQRISPVSAADDR